MKVFSGKKRDARSRGDSGGTDSPLSFRWRANLC